MAIEYTEQKYNYSYLDADNQYREVDSIISTPSAYVDTGFVANSNTKIDCKFMWHDCHSYNFAFGSGPAWDSNNIELYNPENGIAIIGHYSSEYRPNVNFQANVPFIFIQDKNIIQVFDESGTLLGSVDAGVKSFNCGNNLLIFTINREGYRTSKPQTCYYFKIWDDGTLVRDLKPCIRVSDNVAGFYDLVNSQFYTAADSNPLRAGNDILVPNGNTITHQNFYTDENDYRDGAYIVEDSKKYRKHIRPLSGYTQVRYIQGTGSQALVTDYIPESLHSKIEMQFALNPLYMGTNQNLWCTRRTSSTELTWTCFFINGAGLRFDYYNANTQTNSARNYNIPYTVVFDKNRGYVDGALYYTATETEFIASHPLIFFRSSLYDDTSYSSLDNYGYYKLFYCKIWHDNVLVRDYIPVERNIDGELGLYDKINHTFLTNQGSSMFAKGDYVYEMGNPEDFDYMRDFPKWTLTEQSS